MSDRTLTDKQKHKWAEILTTMIGNGFVVHYEPSYVLRRDRKELSRGHIWTAQFWDELRMDHDPNLIVLDDRKRQNISTQLLRALMTKSQMYAAMAVAMEAIGTCDTAMRKHGPRKAGVV